MNAGPTATDVISASSGGNYPLHVQPTDLNINRSVVQSMQPDKHCWIELQPCKRALLGQNAKIAARSE